MTSIRMTAVPCLLVLAILALVTPLGGCSGMTTGGNRYTYKINRELEAYLPTDSFTAHYAALLVLERDFLYTIEEEGVDAREGLIKARTARNKLVKVETSRAGRQLTKVEVFVAPFGDEYMEADILNWIERRAEKEGAVLAGR